MPYCQECGGTLSNTAKFCQQCGFAQSQPPKQDKTFAQANSVPSRQQKSPGKEKGMESRILWGFAGVVLLFIFFAVVNGVNGSSGGSALNSSFGSALNSSGRDAFITPADATILANTGSTYVDVPSLQRLTAGAGVQVDFSNGDGTLRAYADDFYAAELASNSNLSGAITEKDVETQIQPGFGLYVTVTNIFPGSDVSRAVLDVIRSDAAADEAAGRTYEDYRK